MATPASPFAAVRPAVLTAAGYLVAALVWIAAGTQLPGGRWFAVHLFTLGVLSNLVLALSAHFAQTLLHHPGDGTSQLRLLLFNAGALAVLTGVPSGNGWLLAGGAIATSAAVLWLYVALRRIRKGALGQRFGFLVRTYERASGAFLHGAILGGLVGGGILPGTWAGAARTAHLHINVLGWGGLTLLATLVVFGPTVLRARMRPGADDLAAKWLRRGATGLTVGVLALVATGAPEPYSLVARMAAAAGLTVFALATLAVCGPVVRTALDAPSPPANGLLLASACGWFVVAVWVDVLVIATARWALLTTVGAMLLVGVLGQAIVAAVGYLAPLLFRAGDLRADMRRRLDRAPLVRAAVLNAGIVAIVAGVTLSLADLAKVGWMMVLAWLVAHIASAAAQKSITAP